MNGYKMLVGKDSADLINAALAYKFKPTEENKKRLDELQAIIHQKVVDNHNKAETDFISLYGQEVFDFVKSISNENFLSAKTRPYSLNWEIKWDSDNDDYWCIAFFKGHFNYVKDICGGYGGREILEANITIDRVKELFSSRKE